jgi:hypothetical protein
MCPQQREVSKGITRAGRRRTFAWEKNPRVVVGGTASAACWSGRIASHRGVVFDGTARHGTWWVGGAHDKKGRLTARARALHRREAQEGGICFDRRTTTGRTRTELRWQLLLLLLMLVPRTAAPPPPSGCAPAPHIRCVAAQRRPTGDASNFPPHQWDSPRRHRPSYGTKRRRGGGQSR